MSQKAEELVRHGQPCNLMSTPILMWGSTTNAGIRVANVTDMAEISVLKYRKAGVKSDSAVL